MSIKKKIRVLIVDDSFLFRETMLKGLSSDDNIEVVGTASDAYMARDKILSLKPDVMTLDVEMPRINGVEFVKKLMPQYPLPIVMVSSATEKVFEALNAGAVDFVAKPSDSTNMSAFLNELIIKVKIASTAKVGRMKHALGAIAAGGDNKSLGIGDCLIAIGASTGGTEAILEVIKDLPSTLPGIVIVQHMPPVFTKMYADRLNNVCNIEVREAKDGDEVKPGLALIAPGGFQMQVVKRPGGYKVKCFEAEKVNGHAPSVDVLFNSVADVAKDMSLGIILTGMGSDGAKGLLKMRKNGAFTIGQDEKSAVVYGMPMVAFDIGAVQKQTSLNLISNEIIRYFKENKLF